MATFALIHGGGSTGWDWHLVAPLLERAGHDAIAVDLPIEDPTSGLDDYVRAVVDEIVIAGMSSSSVTRSAGSRRPLCARR